MIGPGQHSAAPPESHICHPSHAGGATSRALADEDVTEVWLEAKSEAISKVRRTKGGAKGAEVHCPDEKEVEKTFWLSRLDGWVINKKTKRIIMLERRKKNHLQAR